MQAASPAGIPVSVPTVARAGLQKKEPSARTAQCLGIVYRNPDVTDLFLGRRARLILVSN